MKLSIDEDVIKEQGLTNQEFFTCLAIVETADLTIHQEIQNLINKGYAWIDDEGTVKVFRNIKDKVSKVLKLSDIRVPREHELKRLAMKLRFLYPKGSKPGTNCMWRSNVRDIINQLESFYLLYNEDHMFSKDDIAQATLEYINSFNGNYTYMRTLPNFIIRSENGETRSDLSTALENLGENEPHTFDNVELLT